MEELMMKGADMLFGCLRSKMGSEGYKKQDTAWGQLLLFLGSTDEVTQTKLDEIRNKLPEMQVKLDKLLEYTQSLIISQQQLAKLMEKNMENMEINFAEIQNIIAESVLSKSMAQIKTINDYYNKIFAEKNKSKTVKKLVEYIDNQVNIEELYNIINMNAFVDVSYTKKATVLSTYTKKLVAYMKTFPNNQRHKLLMPLYVQLKNVFLYYNNLLCHLVEIDLNILHYKEYLLSLESTSQENLKIEDLFEDYTDKSMTLDTFIKENDERFAFFRTCVDQIIAMSGDMNAVLLGGENSGFSLEQIRVIYHDLNQMHLQYTFGKDKSFVHLVGGENLVKKNIEQMVKNGYSMYSNNSFEYNYKSDISGFAASNNEYIEVLPENKNLRLIKSNMIRVATLTKKEIISEFIPDIWFDKESYIKTKNYKLDHKLKFDTENINIFKILFPPTGLLEIAKRTKIETIKSREYYNDPDNILSVEEIDTQNRNIDTAENQMPHTFVLSTYYFQYYRISFGIIEGDYPNKQMEAATYDKRDDEKYMSVESTLSKDAFKLKLEKNIFVDSSIQSQINYEINANINKIITNIEELKFSENMLFGEPKYEHIIGFRINNTKADDKTDRLHLISKLETEKNLLKGNFTIELDVLYRIHMDPIMSFTQAYMIGQSFGLKNEGATIRRNINYSINHATDIAEMYITYDSISKIQCNHVDHQNPLISKYITKDWKCVCNSRLNIESLRLFI